MFDDLVGQRIVAANNDSKVDSSLTAPLPKVTLTVTDSDNLKKPLGKTFTLHDGSNITGAGQSFLPHNCLRTVASDFLESGAARLKAPRLTETGCEMRAKAFEQFDDPSRENMKPVPKNSTGHQEDITGMLNEIDEFLRSVGKADDVSTTVTEEQQAAMTFQGICPIPQSSYSNKERTSNVGNMPSGGISDIGISDVPDSKKNNWFNSRRDDSSNKVESLLSQSSKDDSLRFGGKKNFQQLSNPQGLPDAPMEPETQRISQEQNNSGEKKIRGFRIAKQSGTGGKNGPLNDMFVVRPFVIKNVQGEGQTKFCNPLPDWVPKRRAVPPRTPNAEPYRPAKRNEPFPRFNTYQAAQARQQEVLPFRGPFVLKRNWAPLIHRPLKFNHATPIKGFQIRPRAYVPSGKDTRPWVPGSPPALNPKVIPPIIPMATLSTKQNSPPPPSLKPSLPVHRAFVDSPQRFSPRFLPLPPQGKAVPMQHRNLQYRHVRSPAYQSLRPVFERPYR